MELSLLALLPILCGSKAPSANESALKYFLIQTIAGLIFLGGLFRSITSVAIVALLLKLGAFPFYLWVPHIFCGLSFNQIILLSTIQKIPPFVALIHLNTPILIGVIIGSIFLGSIGGIFLANIKKILAYSSIRHTGWIISLISYFYGWRRYLGIYTFISIILLLFIHQSQLKSITQISTFSSPLLTLTLWVLIISLAGFPPLLGFSLKWIRLRILTPMWGRLLIFLVLRFSLRLFFYLNIFIKSTFLINKNKPSTKSIIPLTIIMTNILGLFIIYFICY